MVRNIRLCSIFQPSLIRPGKRRCTDEKRKSGRMIRLFTSVDQACSGSPRANAAPARPVHLLQPLERKERYSLVAEAVADQSQRSFRLVEHPRNLRNMFDHQSKLHYYLHGKKLIPRVGKSSNLGHDHEHGQRSGVARIVEG